VAPGLLAIYLYDRAELANVTGVKCRAGSTHGQAVSRARDRCGPSPAFGGQTADQLPALDRHTARREPSQDVGQAFGLENDEVGSSADLHRSCGAQAPGRRYP
jgi:hypothetical protein